MYSFTESRALQIGRSTDHWQRNGIDKVFAAGATAAATATTMAVAAMHT